MTAEVIVQIPDDSPYFEGHFAGWPVFPAVAQLDALVVPSVRANYPDLRRVKRLTRVRFHRPIGPGERLHLQMSREAQRVVFSLTRDNERVASGVVWFCGQGEQEGEMAR